MAKMIYFPVNARAEAIRMLHAFADVPLEDERVTFEQWGSGLKEKQPLGQLPVYTCEEGELLMSNSIARYLAKKFGMMGENLWEEALNDMMMEALLSCANEIPPKWYVWSIFKRAPEPENKDEIKAELRAKLLKTVNYIQSAAEKHGKKFITSDKICLADMWLYGTLEFSKACIEDSQELTPWVKDFVEKFGSDERVKKYLAARPASVLGV